ncbi:uncharacterized protein LOC131998037 [Stomoxys calcitrans]|uniref:uncharacterized protein LOC131998037 n=1 Tax=Stomoxys calcitrans TaxID=35570 RepID=UPI0027E28777|nr:uncharacterized protein LOC131998037 [Stomoxys calcitrans]
MVKAKKYNVDNRAGKKRIVCRVCLKDHPLRFCRKFLDMDYAERMKIISIYQHCAGCLAHDHTWRTCESTGKCRKCGDMHHTLLHKPGPRSSTVMAYHDGARQGPQPSSKTPSKKGPRPSQSSHQHDGPSSSRRATNRGPSSSRGNRHKRPSSSQHAPKDKPAKEVVPFDERRRKPYKGKNEMSTEVIPAYCLRETILLKATAVIKIVCGDRYIHERAVIDPSIESSIVAESLVSRMGQRVVRVGNKTRCLLQIRGNHGMSATVETYAEVRRNHTVVTPKKSIDVRIVDEFPGLQLADEHFYTSAPVSITLGGDLYPKIMRNGVFGGALGKPLAQFTIFGYVISGSYTP